MELNLGTTELSHITPIRLGCLPEPFDYPDWLFD
jgi:hypothetical protein